YVDTTMQMGGGDATLDMLADVWEYASTLDWAFPQGGLIDFVPAGRRDEAYMAKVSTFDWDAFWIRHNGGPFIDLLRQTMRQHYDFVLIDSRSGLSDSAGICAVQLPDTVINFFTLNRQSIDGAVAITGSIKMMSDRVVVYPVPTRIIDGEKGKLDRGRAYSRRSFRPYLTFLDNEDAETYWNDVEVPYVSYYAFEEVLAVFGDVRHLEYSLLTRYKNVAGRVTGHVCPMSGIVSADRAAVLRAFEQSAPIEPMTIMIAYAPRDRIWAEWLRDRLGRQGYHVVLHCVRIDPPALDDVDRLIVAYSRDFVAYRGGGRLLRHAVEC